VLEALDLGAGVGLGGGEVLGEALDLGAGALLGGGEGLRELGDLEAGVLLGLGEQLGHALALDLGGLQGLGELLLEAVDGDAVLLLALVDLGLVLGAEQGDGVAALLAAAARPSSRSCWAWAS
jgi:hypothetical protein